VRIGLFTDSLEALSFEDVLSWLEQELPEVKDLELGTGGYSPAPHCDPTELLDDDERERWLEALNDRGFRLAALNVSGNPLEIVEHDHHLRRSIELASVLGVDRIVCMSGGRGELAGGNWFPGIDDDRERYWQATVLPYWDEISRLASAHDGLKLCFELEPGAAVYNVATFERVAESRPNLALNLDPSHFFWQSIDPLSVARRLGGLIAFAHGKDAALDGDRIPLDGVLDRRSWRFATVGEGHDLAWWRTFVETLRASGYDDVVSVEYEDPTKSPQQGVLESTRALAEAFSP
jgi:sugar phosphate isomerase/epimerase